MKFNWLNTNVKDGNQNRYYIDMEYKLRPKITKFLIENCECEAEGCPDFSNFHFNVDLKNKLVTLSKLTPEVYRKLIRSDFKLLINI